MTGGEVFPRAIAALVSTPSIPRFARVLLVGVAAALAFSFLSAACSARSAALALYANATLTAGAGLGDLTLGTTTLGPFVARFGSGVSSIVAGDATGIEIAFTEERANFLFVAEGACAERIGRSARTAAAALRDPDTFFREYPDCAAAALRSISFAAAADPADTFYRGRSDAGIALHTPRAEALAAAGPPHDVRGLWLAGSGPLDAGTDLLAWRQGLALSIAEAMKGPAAGHLVVTRIAIFPAE